MRKRLSWTLLALVSAIIMTICPVSLSADVFAEEDQEDNEEEREHHDDTESSSEDKEKDEDNEEEREHHDDTESNNEDKERDGSDQETETNEELDSGGDCNISGKGNTCIMVPANVEASGSAGPTVTSAPAQEIPMLLAMPT